MSGSESNTNTDTSPHPPYPSGSQQPQIKMNNSQDPGSGSGSQDSSDSQSCGARSSVDSYQMGANANKPLQKKLASLEQSSKPNSIAGQSLQGTSTSSIGHGHGIPHPEGSGVLSRNRTVSGSAEEKKSRSSITNSSSYADRLLTIHDREISDIHPLPRSGHHHGIVRRGVDHGGHNYWHSPFSEESSSSKGPPSPDPDSGPDPVRGKKGGSGVSPTNHPGAGSKGLGGGSTPNNPAQQFNERDRTQAYRYANDVLDNSKNLKYSGHRGGNDSAGSVEYEAFYRSPSAEEQDYRRAVQQQKTSSSGSGNDPSSGSGSGSRTGTVSDAVNRQDPWRNGFSPAPGPGSDPRYDPGQQPQAQSLHPTSSVRSSQSHQRHDRHQVQIGGTGGPLMKHPSQPGPGYGQSKKMKSPRRREREARRQEAYRQQKREQAAWEAMKRGGLDPNVSAPYERPYEVSQYEGGAIDRHKSDMLMDTSGFYTNSPPGLGIGTAPMPVIPSIPSLPDWSIAGRAHYGPPGLMLHLQAYHRGDKYGKYEDRDKYQGVYQPDPRSPLSPPPPLTRDHNRNVYELTSRGGDSSSRDPRDVNEGFLSPGPEVTLTSSYPYGAYPSMDRPDQCHHAYYHATKSHHSSSRSGGGSGGDSSTHAPSGPGGPYYQAPYDHNTYAHWSSNNPLSSGDDIDGWASHVNSSGTNGTHSHSHSRSGGRSGENSQSAKSSQGSGKVKVQQGEKKPLQDKIEKVKKLKEKNTNSNTRFSGGHVTIPTDGGLSSMSGSKDAIQNQNQQTSSVSPTSIKTALKETGQLSSEDMNNLVEGLVPLLQERLKGGTSSGNKTTNISNSDPSKDNKILIQGPGQAQGQQIPSSSLNKTNLATLNGQNREKNLKWGIPVAMGIDSSGSVPSSSFANNNLQEGHGHNNNNQGLNPQSIQNELSDLNKLAMNTLQRLQSTEGETGMHGNSISQRDDNHSNSMKEKDDMNALVRELSDTMDLIKKSIAEG